MTRDEIIRMAREAGLSVRHISEPPRPYDQVAGFGYSLERFAALVAAAEREACAQIVEAPHWKPVVRQALAKRAADIRARGV